MKRTIISGFLTLLFLGGIFYAQQSAEIPPSEVPPVGIPPLPMVEIRYYEGEALIHYANGRILRGTAYVLAERDPSSNLFRGRYAICYGGVCTATSYSSWIRGKENNGIWFVDSDGTLAVLGPKKGLLKLNRGSTKILMKLELKQPIPVPMPEPLQDITVQ
ncbi:MAG: hypothetical protein Sv326_0617 [Candidatus Fermentimicrarchaeum limneticum]|uniref:Uncharacterized protein n=1 Tax=Fermentimicrarchaeum limneticum TaxID=2795018 RepID=A0A7D5XHH2_FERL1|nr:MAG: hypothetical protein Sv326_0617 [Candidatus Fermentimicrarchaeum limneticum]